MPPWIEVSRALSTISAICVATAGCAGELTSITHALDLQWLANDVSMRCVHVLMKQDPHTTTVRVASGQLSSPRRYASPALQHGVTSDLSMS